jgi:DNA-binding PadR family transcriptional regulator
VARNRSNPLALAVMVCLHERPMHPYEVATTLRQRAKHHSVKLNFGSLYAVVDSLGRRGLIEAKETERTGRLPERTIYQLTDAGRIEVNDWLADLISTPTTEYPQFVAALSFLPALPPDHVVELLKERYRHLVVEEAQASATRDLVEKHGLPRLLWVEEEYRVRMRETEMQYVRELVRDIESGALEGTEWWREIHERGFDAAPPPPFDPKSLHELHSEGD